MVVRSIFATLALTLLAACSSPTASLLPIGTSDESGYQLGPGDEVRVVVGGFDAITNSYIIGDEGAISLPLIGNVAASGKTPAELEVEIGQTLVGREVAVSPSVNVQVQKYRPFFILGEVQRPGQYPFVPRMSVLTAVSIGGGYTFRADTRAYSIVRPNKGTTIKGRANADTVLKPGDTVIVHEAWF